MNVATKCPYISLLNWCYTKSDIKSKAESHDQIQTNYNSTYTARARDKKRKKPSALWLSIDLHSQLNLSNNNNNNNQTHERKRSATESETEITQINLSYLLELLYTERMNMGTEWELQVSSDQKKYMVEQITGILFSTSFWARTSSILKSIQITQFQKKTNGEWMYLAGDLFIVFYVVRLNE